MRYRGTQVSRPRGSIILDLLPPRVSNPQLFALVADILAPRAEVGDNAKLRLIENKVSCDAGVVALANSGDHECSDATFDGATSKSMRQSFSRLFRRVLQA